jgi:hypothetical protein
MVTYREGNDLDIDAVIDPISGLNAGLEEARG